jgi:transposase
VQGRSAGEIAVMFAASEGYVREVIHAFNESGFAALDPKWKGGRPRKFGPAAHDQICRIAACQPCELGLPFTTWSLSKLVDYLAATVRIRVSTETVRQILRKAGVSWQATKTWKASKDPDFVAKKNRILDLYDNPPADGRVVCVDEFGPLNLQPRPGHGWFRRGEPARLRATYTRTKGRPAHVRRARPRHRRDVLPVPRPQTLAAVPRLLQATPPPLPDRKVLPDQRQLRPTRQGGSHHLVR